MMNKEFNTLLKSDVCCDDEFEKDSDYYPNEMHNRNIKGEEQKKV